MGNFSTVLSSSPFRRKEDFFTLVNLKANLVLVLLPSPGMQWAQWPTESLCLCMQQVFSWCFQTDKSLHYIKERGAAGCPKYNSSVSPEENIKGPRGPNPVVLSAYEGYDEEEERAKVLSRWLIPREEWQTGNLEGKSEY